MNVDNHKECLTGFPKERPPLPEGIRRIYDEYYRRNRSGAMPSASLSQKVEAWLHKQVSADRDTCDHRTRTLEVGAGTLNHVVYEADHMACYDVVEPFAGLYEDSVACERVRHFYADIAELPATAEYDRIVSIAAFEHICNLPEVVARCGLHLAEGGQLRVAIPSEGTWLWRLGWMLTTGLEFRLRYGESYADFLRHEHVNTAREVADVLRWFFRDVRCRVFGISRGVSLYQFYRCTLPDRQRCEAYLASLAR